MHLHACNTGGVDDTFPWTPAYPELSSQAGNCSLLNSTNDYFYGNQATEAGAVVYASSVSTLAISCAAGVPASKSLTSCPAPLWVNNTVGNSSGAGGYGQGVASGPASLVLDMSPVKSYVSNGSVTIPLTIYVMDQTGSNVTAGTCPIGSIQLRKFSSCISCCAPLTAGLDFQEHSIPLQGRNSLLCKGTKFKW